MLELRPNCEYCDKDLPPGSTEARICTYECTFCADCVDNVLRNVFYEDLLVSLLNPKTALFFLAFLPQSWTRPWAPSAFR